MQPDLCIYHGNCADGFTAAWAVRRRFPECIFVAGVYGEPPPDVTSQHVVIVDFSYKKPVLLDLASKAASIVVLDHHKSAQEDLSGIQEAGDDWDSHSGWCALMAAEPQHPVLAVLFDMDRSGARLAWDFFHPGKPIPSLVQHVEDRDLWRFDLPGTREIQACIFSHPYEFDVWDDLVDNCASPTGRALMLAQGEAIERKQRKDIAELLSLTTRSMVIGGVEVPVANIPYTMASEAANILAQGKPFAACYYDKADSRVFSLRSTEDGSDVSVVAAAYGGGGHRNAAGFRAPAGWEGDR